MNCRHCHSKLNHRFLDLGHAPPSNAYLTCEDLKRPEVYFPLRLYVCESCWLVQTEDYTEASELFNDEYAYFSSTSKSWLEHAKKYSEKIRSDLQLDCTSLVIEVASNDGYLLKNFVESKIPCLGIEPTGSTAEAAESIGIPVLRKFFGTNTASEIRDNGQLADLVCANNVYAHVPDINDFTRGLKIILKPEGVITLEFPHFLELIKNRQFDTVYHEHFSYLSLVTVCRIFECHGLRVFDVDQLTTHGGSLRVYGCHKDSMRMTTDSVFSLIQAEVSFGLLNLEVYQSFQNIACGTKNKFLQFVLREKSLGKSIAAYGAAAKGNTLLNFAGLKNDVIDFVCDAAHAKQSKFMPGSHIPILHPSELALRKPDWIIILPWNIASEVVKEQSNARDWGGRFVTAIPEIKEL